MINNEYRRVKAKLSLFLNETEHPIMQTLMDMVEQMEPGSSHEYKLLQLSLLRASYAQYLHDHKGDDPSQTKLFKV